MAIHAFLVGINDYKSPRVNDLNGCENDANLFKKTIQAKYQIPQESIKFLKNQEATRDNIIQGFQKHLLAKEYEDDDVAVFYFAGHGAQSLTPQELRHLEPDELNETLVCHDSRTDNTPDLRDKELRYLLSQLAKKCQHIAVVLDCCHGGHGTRNMGEDNAANIRQAEPDYHEHDIRSYIFFDEEKHANNPKALTELVEQEGKHVLLAGCEDHQLSQERMQGIGQEKSLHGIFTYALCETLNSMQSPISYRELYSRLITLTHKRQPSQTPQLDRVAEFDDAQQVLGAGLVSVNPLVFYREDRWFINVGAMHSWNEGDEFTLVSESSDSEKPTVRIVALDAFESEVEIVSGGEIDESQQYNALVSKRTAKKTGIRVVAEDPKYQTDVAKLLNSDDSPESAGAMLNIDDEQPRYELHILADELPQCLVTHVDDARPLFERTDSIEKALDQITVMAKWWRTLETDNPLTELPTDDIEVYISSGDETFVSEDATLHYQPNPNRPGEWKNPKFSLELKIRPESQATLYCGLAYMDSNTGAVHLLDNVYKLTNQQGHREGEINAATSIKYNNGKQYKVEIKDELQQQGITRIKDYLKLVVSTAPFDLSSLEQAGNKLYSGGDKSRGLVSDDDDEKTDWYSKNIGLTIMRPMGVKKVQPNASISLLSGDTGSVNVEPHANFDGLIRLINVSDENSRSAKSVNDPAVFTGADDSVIDFSKGKELDLGLDAIEVIIPGGSRAAEDAGTATITPENPLNITLDRKLAENEKIIPYTHDGEFFIPLGSSESTEDGKTRVTINHLPTTALSESSQTTRSLGSALKIFFRKIAPDFLVKDKEIFVLSMPEFVEDEPTQLASTVTDVAALKKRVTEADKVLIIIHGIIGETRSMVGCVNFKYAETASIINDDYDLVMGFDYECLNTRIQDIARALKTKLETLGITEGTEKQVDIVAHSMGGLVSRWFIERENGDAMIRKLVMVGTPNGGSPIADVKQYGTNIFKGWANGTLAVAINGLTSVAVGGLVVGGLIKFIDSIDNTLDQMAPSSDLVNELKHSARPNTEYTIIAGDTFGLSFAADVRTGRIARLLSRIGAQSRSKSYQVLTKFLFKRPNDVAVAMDSAKSFNPSWDDVVQMEVNCDHLSYFGHHETVRLIHKELSGK